MSDLLVLGNGVGKPGPPESAARGGENAESRTREGSPNSMYGLRNPLVGLEEMKDKFIAVGVCAMDTKTMASPMQNILERLQVQSYIKILMFTEKTIIEEPIENWPVCDCLIAFYSKGFPLNKAIEYVKLRKPLVFNDLEMQFPLMDRREVYKILNANGVETPPYEVCDRGGEDVTMHEIDDGLEINGRVFHKPFVEKPVSAEDHNIYIYFPSDYGGGSQRLFRKVKNRSSHYSKESSVRTTGSYIYEDFLATDGTDVKVYTVGPDYAHAEARKSPALDGKVERDRTGKEVRYPVILTAKEKLIARAVCMAFKQTVCGFDLLRANGRSYVCDVNGFSFVKNSQKYYDDCAQILLEMITAYLGPHFIPPVPPSVEYLMDEIPEMPVPIPRADNNIELRCVVGVIRHGDRTPKQKMKMIVTHKRFFDLFQELKGYDTGQLKIKKPKLLQRVLDIARCLLSENGVDQGSEIQEKIHKLEQLRAVLEMYGTFSGINRKVQFKLLSKKTASGEPQLLLILKWGGEHTQSGQLQAEELGRAFRIIYPGGEGEYASLPGSGFLRLHSTYRHDLKVYASDEGRVQMTAAAFTKGLLDLEGNPASVLVHLVKRDQAANNMLDTSTNAQEAMNCVKERLHELMRSPHDFTEQSFQELAPTGAKPIVAAMRKVKNPRATCDRLYELIKSLVSQLKALPNKDYPLYHEETLQLMVNRWGKLEKDFKLKNGEFDISKIPDIYDCIKYDLLHNSDQLNLKVGKELLCCVMPLADIVVPQEYGISREEKLDIASKICTPLLRKIQADFHHTIVNEQADVLHRLDHRLSKGVVSPKRHVRTRLYFTSESHVHSLFNLLKYDDLMESTNKDIDIHNVPELNYITQIIFLLFEDLSQPEKSDLRYRVKIHFSPGVRCRDELAVPGEIHSPDLSIKHNPAQFIKRLPIGSIDGPVCRRHSDLSPKLAESADSGKPKELVVRRMSEQLPHTLNCDGRFKSFSETEMLAMRRKCSSFFSPPLDVLRSKSMDTLDLGSSPPKPVSQSLSPRKPLLDSLPLVEKNLAAVRKVSFPSALPASQTNHLVGFGKERDISSKVVSADNPIGFSAERWSSATLSASNFDSRHEVLRNGHDVLQPRNLAAGFPQTRSSAVLSNSHHPCSYQLPFNIEEKDESLLDSSGHSTPQKSKDCSVPKSLGQPVLEVSAEKNVSIPVSFARKSPPPPSHYKGRDSDDMSSEKSAPINNQGSNEQLNRNTITGNGAALWLGERGLVLSADLSSLIHPLSCIGNASLSWVNEYLTSITGIHLNYNLVVQPEELPPLRRYPPTPLTPTRMSSSDNGEWGAASGEYVKGVLHGSPEVMCCDKSASAPPLKGHWSSGGKADSPPEPDPDKDAVF